MNIKVKKEHPDAIIPQYMTPGAGGFDLYAVEDVTICAGDLSVKVSTGLSFEIPEGWGMKLLMKSGYGSNTSLRPTLGTGLIDSDYRGVVSMMFDNVSLTTSSSGLRNHTIKKGQRMCQGVLVQLPQFTFVESEELTETTRGNGGFGHTGIN